MNEDKQYVSTPNTVDIGEDFAKIQEWLRICMSKWYWFLASVVIAFMLAAIYILTTPPIYTRSASILIKEDDNGSSLSSEFGKFSDMGFTGSNTNLYNEMISLKSPSYMLDVVKQLNLDMNYNIDGATHAETLYGKTLPVVVSMLDFDPEDNASFDMEVVPGNEVVLSNLTINGEQQSKDYHLRLGTTYRTPLGRIQVSPTRYFSGSYDKVIHVTKMGLTDATNKCVNNLSVDLNDVKASVVDLKVDDENLERADDILNALFQVYNRKWVEDINKQAISTSAFIDEELRTIEAQLGDVDEDISSFKSKHLVPDITTASNLYMNKADAMSTELLNLDNQIFMARYIRKQLMTDGSKNKPLPVSSGIENNSLTQLISSYNDKLIQRNNLVANSSAENPLVVDIDQTLQASRHAIVQSIDNEIVQLKNRIADVQGSVHDTKSQIASNPTQAKYLLSVERQQKVKEQLYLFLLQKREENQLSKAFTAYNTKMLNPPGGSKRPSKPVKMNVFLIALALGLFVPMVLIFIASNMDTAVHCRKDVEALTLPFLGEIPLSYKKRRGIFALFNKRKEIREIVVQEKNRNEINEAFRVVRTNLEFISGKTGSCKSIMFTSANPGSGKTFVTMNLATSFAIKNKKVIVFDLDMRKASLSTFVDSPETGISDYLSGSVENFESVVVKGKTNPNLAVVPVGTIPPNPTELLFSERLEKAFSIAREQYDYIFIDCPPLDIVADASIINKFSDLTVFVIRAELFDKSMLRDVQKNYDEKRYKNMMLILNGTVAESNGYGYHKYGYSYSYGYGYGE